MENTSVTVTMPRSFLRGKKIGDVLAEKRGNIETPVPRSTSRHLCRVCSSRDGLAVDIPSLFPLVAGIGGEPYPASEIFTSRAPQLPLFLNPPREILLRGLFA